MTKRTQAPRAGGRREQLRQQAVAAEAKRRQRRILLVGVAIVVAAAIVVGVVVGVQALRGRAGEVAGVTPPNANADNTGIIANPGVAAADAPVLTIYQDFQCPACKSFEDALGATVAEMAASGQVTLEYRTMTFLDRNLRNDASFRAGVAAACADVAGAYGDYYGVIYANQPVSEGTGYTDDQLLTRFPEQAGLTGETLESFKSCYRDEATAAFVRGTDAASSTAGVTSTPTIRVNGNDLDPSPFYANPAGFAAAVEQAAG